MYDWETSSKESPINVSGCKVVMNNDVTEEVVEGVVALAEAIKEVAKCLRPSTSKQIGINVVRSEEESSR